MPKPVKLPIKIPKYPIHLITKYSILIYQSKYSIQFLSHIWQKVWPLRNTAANIQTQKCFVSWITVWALEPSLQSKCPERTFMLPQNYHVSVSNMLLKPLKCFMENENNINFRDQTWVRLPAKCWFKGFILSHRYHGPNFYQRFWHTLAN